MTATPKPHPWIAGMLGACVLLASTDAQAQLNDNTQAPNIENADTAKSLAQQVGAGVGDWSTPNSSLYITNRDPARSIRRGRQSFLPPRGHGSIRLTTLLNDPNDPE